MTRRLRAVINVGVTLSANLSPVSGGARLLVAPTPWGPEASTLTSTYCTDTIFNYFNLKKYKIHIFLKIQKKMMLIERVLINKDFKISFAFFSVRVKV